MRNPIQKTHFKKYKTRTSTQNTYIPPRKITPPPRNVFQKNSLNPKFEEKFLNEEAQKIYFNTKHGHTSKKNHTASKKCLPKKFFKPKLWRNFFEPKPSLCKMSWSAKCAKFVNHFVAIYIDAKCVFCRGLHKIFRPMTTYTIVRPNLW